MVSSPATSCCVLTEVVRTQWVVFEDGELLKEGSGLWVPLPSASLASARLSQGESPAPSPAGLPSPGSPVEEGKPGFRHCAMSGRGCPGGKGVIWGGSVATL